MAAQRADVDDIRYAYRLLLGRAPDAGGLRAYKKLVADQALTPSALAAFFLGSAEFRARYSARFVEVDLGAYKLVIRADDNDVGKAVATNRTWEPQVASAVGRFLSTGGTFVDVGANIGYFTALAAHTVGPSGQVVAIEPMDKNIQCICATLARNAFQNVRIEPFAASDATGTVCMSTHGGSSNGEVLREWSRGDQPLFAQTRRLDDLLATQRRVDLVKFDIEGHELNAWRGFSRTLEGCRPAVLTEFHPRCLSMNAGVDPREYAATLLGYGRVTVMEREGARPECRDVDEVMRRWAREDDELQTGGAAHLDLLVEPLS